MVTFWDWQLLNSMRPFIAIVLPLSVDGVLNVNVTVPPFGQADCTGVFGPLVPVRANTDAPPMVALTTLCVEAAALLDAVVADDGVATVLRVNHYCRTQRPAIRYSRRQR